MLFVSFLLRALVELLVGVVLIAICSLPHSCLCCGSRGCHLDWLFVPFLLRASGACQFACSLSLSSFVPLLRLLWVSVCLPFVPFLLGGSAELFVGVGLITICPLPHSCFCCGSRECQLEWPFVPSHGYPNQVADRLDYPPRGCHFDCHLPSSSFVPLLRLSWVSVCVALCPFPPSCLCCGSRGCQLEWPFVPSHGYPNQAAHRLECSGRWCQSHSR